MTAKDEVGWSFLTTFLTCLWSGVKACTAQSWDKQDSLTVWGKVSPASMVLREEWGKMQSTPSHELYWKGNVVRGEVTLPMLEKMGLSISYLETVVTEAMSSCLHGNRTWGAGWFRRTGADFGNQERNDFELVDGEGRQPGGQASHWQTHPPLPEKRSFLLGRSERKILVK